MTVFNYKLGGGGRDKLGDGGKLHGNERIRDSFRKIVERTKLPTNFNSTVTLCRRINCMQTNKVQTFWFPK